MVFFNWIFRLFSFSYLSLIFSHTVSKLLKFVEEKCYRNLTRYVNFSSVSSFFFSLFFFPFSPFIFFLEISLFHRSIPLINRFSQIHLSIRIREVKTNRFWSHVTHGFTINIDHDRRHDSCPHVVTFLF